MPIPNIEIHNFRGIKYSSIKDFGKYVNLFIGKNNCGKSSVLDALYLMFSAINPQITVDINGFRDHIKPSFQDTIEVLFYKLNLQSGIELKFDAQTISQSVKIIPVFQNSENIEFDLKNASQIGSDKIVKGLQISSQIVSDEKSVNYDAFIEEAPGLKDGIQKLRATIRKADNVKLDFEVKYISAKTPFALDVSFIEHMIEYKEQQVLIEALQLIDNRIVDIAVLKERVYIDLGIEKLMPVEVLGDGIRRTINIISNIYKCKNGILLVDEFDNGMHYSSLPVIWKAIIHTVIKFNVQFFATTHNIDSLKTLKESADGFAEVIKSEIRCIKLEHEADDILKSYNYSFPEFSYAVEMEHEIR